MKKQILTALQRRVLADYKYATKREHVDWEYCEPLLYDEYLRRSHGRKGMTDEMYNAERWSLYVDKQRVIGNKDEFMAPTKVEEDPMEYTEEDFIKETFSDDVITDLLER